MAQNLIGLPELKVELGGTVDAPALINNSANNIIGYVLWVESDAGITALPAFKLGSLARNPLESAGIVQGGKDVFTRGVQAGMQSPAQEVHKDGTPVITQKVSRDDAREDGGRGQRQSAHQASVELDARTIC